MNNNSLDLDDALADFFDKRTGNHIILGMVEPEGDQVSLLQDPGSGEIDAPYFNGNRQMALNYELLYRSKDYLDAREKLTPYANLIDKINDETVVSKNHSFICDHATISGVPFNQIIEPSGEMLWVTNFQVAITKINN